MDELTKILVAMARLEEQSKATHNVVVELKSDLEKHKGKTDDRLDSLETSRTKLITVIGISWTILLGGVATLYRKLFG